MAEPVKEARYPGLAEFVYDDVDLPGYQRTYVPGESELTSRLLGLPPRYTYEAKMSTIPDQFQESELKDPKLWEIYIDKVWENVAESAYDPSKSPIKEVEPNVFEINTSTEFGKVLQSRIDLAYSRARHQKWPEGHFLEGELKRDLNPDRDYEPMLKGEEPLLGDIYFDEEGNFEDVWNISVDEHEPLLTPTNLIRKIGAPLLEMNQPIVRGKATYKGYE
tara:strand:- start:35 stop:694 length:660 start_codon:yes stop_codon:yes gene_type:complete